MTRLVWGTKAALLLAATGTPVADAQSPRLVEVGSARGASGKVVRGTINSVEDADGTPLGHPVVVVTGRRAGPVVWVQALSHGDEYGGALALQSLVAGLDPETLRGTVIALMVANPAAFQGLQRVNPNLDDLQDLGTAYPGRAGFATERIAAALRVQLERAKPDYFLDLHTGGDRFLEHPFVFYTQLGRVAAARYDSLALLFGMPTIWRDTLKIFPGGPTTYMSMQGVPSFLVEVGGGQPVRAEDIALQADVVRSFLRGVGILPGRSNLLPRYTVLRGYRIVTNARGGFFRPAVKPGDVIKAGSVLGTITNVFGDVVETLTAPAGSMLVIGMSTYPAWASGGWLFELGTEVSVLERGAGPR